MMRNGAPLAEVVASLTKWVALVLVAMLEAIIPAGCASSQTIFRTHAEDAAPFESLVVFTDLEGYPPDIQGWIHLGLRMHMMEGLAACGVRSKMVVGDPLLADDSDTALAIKEFEPDASLTIKAIRGGRLIVLVDQAGNAVKDGGHPQRQLDQLVFSFQLLDFRIHKVIWSGTAEFKMKSRGTVVSGKEFATGIVSQLRADGVLKGCHQ